MNTPVKIGKEFCLELADKLGKGEPVRFKLPAGGRLHIDRQLPFLCVYRRPEGHADTGTEQLLTSQAAYLIVSSSTQTSAELAEMINTIAASQAKIFGAFLLLEIWTKTTEGDELTAPSFSIVAADSNPPVKLLEAMESALLRARIADETPAIHCDYRQSVSPPGMAALVSEQQAQSINCTSVGIEINPVFRDPKTSELFVYSHKEFRHRLNRALKRSFYEFTHNYTSHKPAHFHELGPRALTRAVKLVDQKLAEIGSKFDLLLFVSPVNSTAAWEEFKQHNYERSVEFLYRPRTIDPDLLKRRLFEVPIETVEDPGLAYIFTAKRDELDRMITLLSDRNTPRFILSSRQLFGDMSPDLLQLARTILEKFPAGTGLDVASETLNAEQFAAHAREELEYYSAQDKTLSSTVQLRADIPGIMVSHGNFLIGSNAQVSKSRLQATLAHEIGTHVVTYHNGRQQPFQELYTGMAGYETLQEGLAVLSEYLVGELGSERLRQLAGRVLAVHMIISGADFMETFGSLYRDYDFSARSAFMMTMRTYRGGGYTKDAVYLQGLVEVLDYLAKGKDLQTLYLGKIAHEYIPLIEELRWRQVLEAPSLVPRLFTMDASLEKLKRLAQGLTVLDLNEGSM
jgi:uncharacterized protein (TIGR02421 family)